MSTTTLAHVHANRDSIWRVTVREGLWRVVKINPKNVKLINVATGALLNAHPSFLVLADGVLDDMPVDTEPEVETFDPGTVVRFKPTPRAPQGLFVVVRATGYGATATYSVHPLGGSSRYFRGVRPSTVVKVTGTVEIPA